MNSTFIAYLKRERTMAPFLGPQKSLFFLRDVTQQVIEK